MNPPKAWTAKGGSLPGAIVKATDRSSEQQLCLMGPRHLAEHLHLLEDHAPDGIKPDLGEAAAFWRSAQATYERLQSTEAGAADGATVLPLPDSMRAHVDRLLALPAVRDCYDTVPVAFGMIDLERLVVSQYSLTRSILDRLLATSSRRPSGRALAALCLPLDAAGSPCRTVIRGEHEFAFAAHAHDMRFLAAQVVDPGSLPELARHGHVGAVVALSVGFSSNLLNVVRHRNRYVLNNGHHRAYALRAMGVKRAPCLIQPCASSEDLRQAATTEIFDNDDLYFDAPRPPLLRDFDRPELARAVATQRLHRIVRLRFEIDSTLAAIDQ